MSLKGIKFKRKHLPERLSPKFRDHPEVLNEYLAAQTERFRIVARGPKGEPYIAEELNERALRLLPEKSRVIATMMMHLTPEDRMAVVNAFNGSGQLKIPFRMVNEEPIDEPVAGA